jgi:uncharacterized protein HemX
MRLRGLVLAAVAAVAALVLLLPAGAASAQGTPPSGQRSVDGSIDTSGEPLPEPHMIPRPNEGHEPIDAGDRGGALQLGLLALLVVVIAGGVAYAVHESRKARADDYSSAAVAASSQARMPLRKP